MHKTFLIEGINGCGKDYVCAALREEFRQKGIRYIKFPNNLEIIREINYLTDRLPFTPLDEQHKLLKIIHNLFDLDFRIFNLVVPVEDREKRFWLINRYYPSNVVYANLHHVWEMYWAERFSMMPIDTCIFLKVQESEKQKYLDSLKVHVSTIPSYLDQVTPDILYHDGQDLYERLLWHEKEKGNIKQVMVISALQENTVEMVKLAFMAACHSNE